MTLIVCNCNSVRFFECVIVIVLAFCYYRLLLACFFKSLDLKKIDVYRLLFIATKFIICRLQKFIIYRYKSLCLIYV